MSQVSQNPWASFLLSALSFAPGLGWAQPMEQGGNGIKVGEGRLHPFLGLDLRYDSAAGFFGTNDQLQPEIIAHIMPGLRLQVPGSDFDLNLDGRLDYVRYTGWLSSGSQNASRLQASADLTTAIHKNGSMELDLADHFFRSDRTSNLAVGVGVLSLYNDVHAGVPVRPGGGALEITPAIDYDVELFQSISAIATPNCTDPICDPTQVPSMNYQTVRPALEGRWKFLPKTAVLVEARMDFRSYINGGANPPAQLLKVWAGLAGLITPKLAGTIKAGYSQDFGSSAVHTILAQLELNFLMTETTHIKFGGIRETQPVPVYGTYADTRGYVDASILLGGRLTLRNVDSIDYVTFYSGSGRHDTIFSVDLGPEYQFARWLSGRVGYILTSRSSNLAISSINFTRHEALIQVMFTY
jgi:hypothetical protein